MMRIGTQLGLGMLGLLLFVAVASSTAWNLRTGQADWGTPIQIPDDPDIALGLAIAEFRLSGRIPSDAVLYNARAAAGLDPLEDEQLLLASLTNTAGAHRRAIGLLKEARRRNPAASEVRVLLLDRYLRTSDMAGAIGEIGALSTLLPADKQQDLSQLLLGLVAAPETRQGAIEALARSPMRKNLIGELARAGASSYLLLDLSKNLVSIVPGSEEAVWSQSVTQALVDQGDLAGARRLWEHYFSISPDRSQGGVFDETFAGFAAPPFGWQLTSLPGAHTEFEKSGLRVRYEGSDAAMLARELLLLPPGRYRLDYVLADADGQPPNLAWRIDCLKTGGALLDLSMGSTYSFEATQSPEFSVPSDGCPGQWLALTGRALPVPSMRTALFRSVKVSQVSAR